MNVKIRVYLVSSRIEVNINVGNHATIYPKRRQEQAEVYM